MNTISWIGRNAEFITLTTITQLIMAFKELAPPNNLPLKNQFISAKHGSQAVLDVLRLLSAKMLHYRDEETEQMLAIYLSLAEPLLLNDENLARALDANVTDILVQLISVEGKEEEERIKKQQGPLYLKLAMRCLTSCLRSEQAVAQISVTVAPTRAIDKLVHLTDVEEIVANGCKCIRIVLRD